MSFPVPEPLPSPSPTPQQPPVRPPAPSTPPPDTTGDPDPARPSLTPAPPNWDYSGITPSEMTRFERDLSRAEDVLRAHEPRLRQALDQVRLDTSALAALREMGNWISAKRPELRRRNETIQSLTTTWGADAPDMAPFDEALYNRASSSPDVYAAATRLAETATTGEVDEKTLAALEQRIGEPAFATLLMNALGAETYRKVMARTVRGDEELQRLQVALSKALGTASSRLDAGWRAELTSGLVQWDHQALAKAIAHGTFEPAFLLQVARAVDAHDRRTPLEGGTVFRDPHHDPIVDMMRALGRNPEAAQDFFAKDPTALGRYLTERPTVNGQDELGKALEAAITVFRDREGTVDNPSRGFVSAELASEFVELQRKRISAGKESAVPAATTALILAAYMPDSSFVSDRSGLSGSRVRLNQPAHWPPDEPWGAQFRTEDVRKVMAEVFEDDPDSVVTLMAAQTVWSQRLLDHNAASGDRDAFVAAAKQVGSGFGLVTDATGLAGIAKGEELDEAQERKVKAVMAVVNTGLAIPQTAGWPVTAGVVGAWTGLVEDSAKTELNKDDATYEANRTKTRSEFLATQLIAQAMFDHGHFGEEGRRPLSFIKPDGSLMTLGEMTPEGAVVHPHFESYENWIADDHRGTMWKQSKEGLISAYDRAFSEYK
ncbi:hypothetical protein SAMN05421874_11591 [Nonomuraea maritima]|uniref:Uncharacterized protein n=1 Tax=Nonomuraea maritima TaxID=683260 RepID=A0A1G9H4L9_9ACTN|nr:DUF6571 family protein [Nonomuraea maritima]SDL07926.1 hypothetical protein SAMN05421874_11591 [Nonomuraea maritima]